MNVRAILFLVGTIGLLGAEVASAAPLARTVRIEGRAHTMVTTGQIALGDVADIHSTRSADDDAVIALRKIRLGTSPAPAQKVEIPAERVVDAMRRAGVRLQNVSYRFPRTLVVERAARTLEVEEVRGVLERYLQDLGKEVEIRNVRLDREVSLAPGESHFTVRPAAGRGNVGYMNFEVTVDVPEAPEVRFQSVAQVSEWGEIPVAMRPLARGEVVSESDVVRARVNLSALPREAALEESEVLGMKLDQALNPGEIFRRDKLAPPPVVLAGDKIVMVYRGAFFDASATGVAIETGAVGDQVKVRNDGSKRVVSGIAIEPGVVQVGGEGTAAERR